MLPSRPPITCTTPSVSKALLSETLTWALKANLSPSSAREETSNSPFVTDSPRAVVHSIFSAATGILSAVSPTIA